MQQPSINYVVGDATQPQAVTGATGPAYIAHVCNDVGGWGAGFVLALSARWREPEEAYYRWYEERASNDFALGAVQIVPVDDGSDTGGQPNGEGVAGSVRVANLIGQRDIVAGPDGPPVRYEAIETALATLASTAAAEHGSVHMPRIGCGLAGGRWDQIEPIIEGTLLAAGVPTVVYDLPQG